MNVPFVSSVVNSLEFHHIGGTPERLQIELKLVEGIWFLNYPVISVSSDGIQQLLWTWSIGYVIASKWVSSLTSNII